MEYKRDGRAPVPLKAITSKIMSSIRAKNTKPELLLRKALWDKKIRGYRLHWKKVAGRPDIAFPGKKIAVFVNGCYWHRCPHCNPSAPKSNVEFWENKFARNIARDTSKNLELVSQGWRVLTIWECELKRDINSQVNRVNDLLKTN